MWRWGAFCNVRSKEPDLLDGNIQGNLQEEWRVDCKHRRHSQYQTRGTLLSSWSSRIKTVNILWTFAIYQSNIVVHDQDLFPAYETVASGMAHCSACWSHNGSSQCLWRGSCHPENRFNLKILQRLLVPEDLYERSISHFIRTPSWRGLWEGDPGQKCLWMREIVGKGREEKTSLPVLGHCTASTFA